MMYCMYEMYCIHEAAIAGQQTVQPQVIEHGCFDWQDEAFLSV